MSRTLTHRLTRLEAKRSSQELRTFTGTDEAALEAQARAWQAARPGRKTPRLVILPEEVEA
jgi:hypothetical protein